MRHSIKANEGKITVYGIAEIMYQNKAFGVVGGVLGRNAKLKFQQRITEKSVILIYQYTF